MTRSPVKKLAVLVVVIFVAVVVARCSNSSFDYELHLRNGHPSCDVTVQHTGDPAGSVTLTPGDTHVVPLTDGEHRLTVAVPAGCELLEWGGISSPGPYTVAPNPLSLTCDWTAEKPDEAPWWTFSWRSSFGEASREWMPVDLLPDDGLDYDAGPSNDAAHPPDLEMYVVVQCPRMERESYYDISG